MGLTLSSDQVERGAKYRFHKTMRKTNHDAFMMYQSRDRNSVFTHSSAHKRTARCYTFWVPRQRQLSLGVVFSFRLPSCLHFSLPWWVLADDFFVESWENKQNIYWRWHNEWTYAWILNVTPEESRRDPDQRLGMFSLDWKIVWSNSSMLGPINWIAYGSHERRDGF